ncbi:hypothetical protein JL720_7222 [Aureococcus anophagefferens]|nr:hypothetical protein JL720_7222 [Aureococcus anophagefferens]
MLRRIKKFTVYSSAIVVGQASRALDNAPFAGQDESEDAKNLLRTSTQLHHRYDPDRDRPALGADACEFPVRPRAARASAPSEPYNKQITGPIPTEIGQLTALKRLWECGITGPIPTEIGQLTALTELRVPRVPTPGEARDRPRRRRYLTNTKITGTRPVEFGQLTKLTYLRVPPRPRRPARQRPPWRRRYLNDNEINGTLPVEFGQLTNLKSLRVPPAPPTPGAPRDRASASQVALPQPHHRHASRPLRSPHRRG